jgi:hypothetical protein
MTPLAMKQLYYVAEAAMKMRHGGQGAPVVVRRTAAFLSWRCRFLITGTDHFFVVYDL